MNLSGKALRFLFVAAVLSGATSCTTYRLTETRALGERIDAALPNGNPTHLILRVTNDGEDRLHIDWSSAHLRGPDGLESPVQVLPSTALHWIYPGGAVEYHLVPEHRYLPADRQGERRNSLSDDLVPEDLFARYEENYELSVRVLTCRDGGIPCFSGGQQVHEAWKVSTVSGRVRRAE